MSDDAAGNAGFDDWLDALDAGAPYYLECEAGHSSLPPRRVCPTCGSDALSESPLPDVGEVETFTVTHVPTPSFEEDAPYATAIADFGPVRITGFVLGDPERVENGLTVSLEAAVSETTGERIIGLKPR